MDTAYQIEQGRRRNRILDTWEDDQHPALLRIRNSVQATLDACEDIRECRDLGYTVDANQPLREFASELARMAYDFLRNAHGRIVTEGDDAGCTREDFPLDLSELAADVERWSAE